MAEITVDILTGAQIGVEVTGVGPAGTPGKSAYRYAVEGGYTGAEQEFYTDLASTGGGVAGVVYIAQFKESDFEASGIRCFYRVPAQKHGLGYRTIVKECLRECAEGVGNVWYQYTVLPNGDVVLYSHEPFNGKITIEKL